MYVCMYYTVRSMSYSVCMYVCLYDNTFLKEFKCMYVCSSPSVAVVFTAKSQGGGVRDGCFGMELLFTTTNDNSNSNSNSNGGQQSKEVVLNHFSECMWGDVVKSMAAKSNNVWVARKRPSLDGTNHMYSIHIYTYIHACSKSTVSVLLIFYKHIHSLQSYIHTCMHPYMHTYIHTHITTNIHAYIHIYIHTYYIHTCIYTYIYTYTMM